MIARPRFPVDSAEFTHLKGLVGQCIDTSCRLPDWPFRATGFLTICEYDRVLGGQFGRALEALAADFGDTEIHVTGIEPEVSYFRDGYGIFPAFSLDSDSCASGYEAGLRYEPGGDPTGALGDSLNVVAIIGSSGAWSVWAQRDWEIGLLLTAAASGSWKTIDVPWFGPDVDLDSIRSPAGWGLTLTDGDLATFRRHIQERGCGGD